MVNQRQFFDAVAVEDGFGFGLGAAGRGGDEAFAGCHDIADQDVFVFLDPDVPAGDDTEDNVAGIDDGESFDVGFAHAAAELAEGGVGRDGFRAGDDDVFGAFDTAHHGDLLFQRAVAVDDAKAAFAGQSHGEAFLRHGVHRGGDDRNGEADVAGEMGGEVGLGGQDAAASGHDGHVVEAQADGKLFIHDGGPENVRRRG